MFNKVDKCLRTYYKLSCKHVNTAKIISKVMITSLSLINSNKDFDFVGWVIKTPCVFYFRSVKFHYVKETHDINSLLTLVKIVLASQHKKTTKQIFVKICWQLKTPTRTWKCTRCTMQMSYSYLPFKTFANSPNKQKQHETLQKRILDMINHSLGNSEINSIPEWRVFLLKVAYYSYDGV